MPNSFFDIERKKRLIVFLLLAVIIITYFVFSYFVGTLAKCLWGNIKKDDFDKMYFSFLSIKETILCLILAAIIGFIHWAWSLRDCTNKILAVIKADPLNLNDKFHKLFKNTVEEISLASGIRGLEIYIISSTQLNAFSLADFNQRKIIGITEGLLAKLNRRQLQAVIGHEIAHILNGDSLLTTVTCSVFEIYEAILANILKLRFSRDLGAVNILIIFLYIITFILNFISNVFNIFISRNREYRADAQAVQFSRDPLSLAEALYVISRSIKGQKPNIKVKYGLFSDKGNLDEEPIFLTGPDEKEPKLAITSIYIVNPKNNKLDDEEGLFADMFSTHPPIKNRIEILLKMASTDINTLESMYKASKIEIRQIDKNKDPVIDEGLSEQNISSDNNAKLSQYKCPICTKSLAEIDYEDNILYTCQACKGSFFQRGHLMRILLRREKGFSPEVIKQSEDIIQATKKKDTFIKLDSSRILKCPLCNKNMKNMFFSWRMDVNIMDSSLLEIEPLSLAIDKCVWCDMLWLDWPELEMLQYIYEKYTTDEEV